MLPRTLRVASRLSGALLMLLITQIAIAQDPKDPPKKDTAKENPDEQKAKEAFLAGKLDDALKALQAAAKTNSSMAPPKAILAQWCVETQQGQQARVLIEQAAAEDPTHPQVLLTNASFALAEGRITDTIMSCAAALQHSDNPRWDADRKKTFQREARLGLVAAFDVRGDFASVKTNLLALLDADAKNAGLRQRLARANFLLSRPEDALADLKTAFADDPTLDPPELTMAQLWTGKADFGKADEWFGKAVAAARQVRQGPSRVRGLPARSQPHRHGEGAISRRHRKSSRTRRKPSRSPGSSLATRRITPARRRSSRNWSANIRRMGSRPRISRLFWPKTATRTGSGADANWLNRTLSRIQRSAEARAIYAYCLFKAGRTGDSEKVARSAFGLDGLTPDAAYFRREDSRRSRCERRCPEDHQGRERQQGGVRVPERRRGAARGVGQEGTSAQEVDRLPTETNCTCTDDE